LFISRYPADYLLIYDRLYEQHTYGSNGDPPHLCNLWFKKRPDRLHTDCTASTILKIRLGKFCQNSKWQRKISQFYWLLLTVFYLWRYLIGNIWWNIPQVRYGYLKLNTEKKV
jgi:hypothetical protein